MHSSLLVLLAVAPSGAAGLLLLGSRWLGEREVERELDQQRLVGAAPPSRRDPLVG